MSIGAWTLVIVMASLSGSALLVIYLGKKTGQFDDVEGVKYRMLEEETDADHDQKASKQMKTDD